MSTVDPDRVIGDLAVIVDEPRQVSLTTLEDSRFLRIGADQFRSVVENDKTVLLHLLKTVGGHLTGAADVIRSVRAEIPREPPPPRTERIEEPETDKVDS